MFGKKLRMARAEKGYTLEQLARVYNATFSGGLSKGTLSKYENEKQEPMISVVGNLSTILNVSVDYLLGKEGKPTDAAGSADPQREAARDTRELSREKQHNHDRLMEMLDQLPEERQQVIENLIAVEWTQLQQHK